MNTTTQAIQQISVEAIVQISNVFGSLSTVAVEKEAIQITIEMDLLMKGWQRAIDSFQELKASALTKAPELGPLFGHAEEKEQTKWAIETSGPMETKAAGNN